jgi:hypothetical protein
MLDIRGDSKTKRSFSLESVNLYSASMEIVKQYLEDASVTLLFCLLFIIYGKIGRFSMIFFALVFDLRFESMSSASSLFKNDITNTCLPVCSFSEFLFYSFS